jgi:hypothetical protein
VTLVFDIFQGIGIAAAIGIRPFLPSLAIGALAAGGIETHLEGTRFEFAHSSYSFLQGGPFLLVMAVLAIAYVALDRGVWGERLHSRAGLGLLAILSAALGALLFAGDLCRGGHPVWLGYVLGVVFAALGVAASLPFLARLRTRLDPDAAAIGVPLIAEGSALVMALASVFVPPLGVVAVIALLVLIWRGRGRDQQKYAGLRILR